MLMIEVTIKVMIKVTTVVTDSVIVVMEVTEVMIVGMTVVTTEVMVVEAMTEVMVAAEGAVVLRAISEKVIGNVNPVVLTTLPDVRNVSNVTLVKVVVVVEGAMKGHLTEVAVVGLMSEMEIGSAIAAVITLLSVWNASNVKNLKCEHVNRKWNC